MFGVPIAACFRNYKRLRNMPPAAQQGGVKKAARSERRRLVGRQDVCTPHHTKVELC